MVEEVITSKNFGHKTILPHLRWNHVKSPSILNGQPAARYYFILFDEQDKVEKIYKRIVKNLSYIQAFPLNIIHDFEDFIGILKIPYRFVACDSILTPHSLRVKELGLVSLLDLRLSEFKMNGTPIKDYIRNLYVLNER